LEQYVKPLLYFSIFSHTKNYTGAHLASYPIDTRDISLEGKFKKTLKLPTHVNILLKNECAEICFCATYMLSWHGA
jgi:hypothetical protein